MSGEEDLYLNQSEAEALFFSDALLGNADELDFESFGDASGLDDGAFNGITGASLTSYETRDIFKPNGDSFVDEVEAKCDSNLIIQQQQDLSANGGAAAAYSNGTLHTNSYMFNKPTLDLENMGMAYGISGLYQQQGNGVTGLGSPSSPSMSQSGLLSPSIVASEKLNGLTLAPHSYCPVTTTAISMGFHPGMANFSSARAMPASAGTKPFLSSSQTSPVAQVQPTANGMSRFGSQEMLIIAAESSGLSQSTSPTLSPNSSDGKEQVERLMAAENGMKMSLDAKQSYYGMHPQGVMQRERVVDTADFVDQVDGDGDGLQPLPQMTRPSMQRSFSSHALGGLRHMGSAPPSSENGVNSRQSQIDRSSGGLTSPGARLLPNLAEFQSMGMRPMMRRVYSAGDIQTLNGMQGGLSGSASPSFEDGNYRVGKYSMEERKIRIHRYQQKRTQRNFNKKIKYACRKTLADSRPRVRGRFAKNMDDDIPMAILNGRKREDDDDEEGDSHVGGEANGYHFENSSGEYSDMLTSVKLEHRTVNSM